MLINVSKKTLSTVRHANMDIKFNLLATYKILRPSNSRAAEFPNIKPFMNTHSHILNTEYKKKRKIF